MRSETSNPLAGSFLATFAGDINDTTKKGMNNRLKTDFLCPSSSFLTGWGSVINVRGHLYDYNASDDPDSIAIGHDWRMIGQDIRDAIEKFDAEFGRKVAR